MSPLAESPRDPYLFVLVRQAVDDGYRAVLSALDKAGGVRIAPTGLPVIEYFHTGFPNLASGLKAKQSANYGSMFGDSKTQRPIRYDTIPSFQALMVYAEHNLALRDYYLTDNMLLTDHGPDRVNDEREMLQYHITELAISIIDRYLHFNGTTEFEDDVVLRLYLEREAAILDTDLPIEFIVPILATHFSIPDVLLLSENTRIERLDSLMQLARMRNSPSLASVPEPLLGAATHALVLTGFNVPHTPYWSSPKKIAGPEDAINDFFNAMQIDNGMETGYAQILYRPLQWASTWSENLPSVLEWTVVRRYPDSFDNFGWLRKPIPLSVESLTTPTLDRLQNADRRVRLASRRLGASTLRTNEEDVIIDLCIGLEALLAGEGKTEVTYQLALRAAALCAGTLRLPPSVVADDIKKIYNFRSKVVHGADAPSKYRMLPARSERKGISAVSAARVYLRATLIALLARPELLGGNNIDEQLVMTALHAASHAETREKPDEAQENSHL